MSVSSISGSGVINDGGDFCTGGFSSAGINRFLLFLPSAAGCNLFLTGLPWGESGVFDGKFCRPGLFGGGGFVYLFGIEVGHVVSFRWIIFFDSSIYSPYLISLRKTD